jgi:tetratricopeptide (TPR) repeat protein
MRDTWKLLIVVCALVIGMYAYTAPLGRLESSFSDPADDYYNLLVDGFRAGHLSLKKEMPAGFAHLADPYDPDANRPYRGRPYGMNDQSYYKGRLYLYFGITPALILFWPFVVLTGHYLTSRLAVVIFCAVGVAVNLGLLRALWRRYFPEVNVWVVALCALALGLATGVPMLLPQSIVYQVPISCGYMLAMLALGAIWCALHDEERRCRWLIAASVAYGLAVGARPTLLFGAVILLLPVVYAWRERQPIWAALLAASVPISLIGLGLMLYNAQRFDNPFEFGMRYQLNDLRLTTRPYLSPRFLWINFVVHFLEPACWSAPFPFVHKAAVPPLPSGYDEVQDAFGVLTNIPLVWLVLAAPLAWRGRSDPERNALRWFVTTLCLLFSMCALSLGFYFAAAGRYQMEFLPALILLAVVGILGSERALADQPGRRRLARYGWSALLIFSVIFNVLVSLVNYAYAGDFAGRMLTAKDRAPEAIRVFENVVRIKSDYPEGHNDFGFAFWQAGKRQEAIREYEYALQLRPDYADAHLALGTALTTLGRPEDAMRHCEEALRIYSSQSPHAIKYACASAQVEIGNALLTQGKAQDAIAHYEEALRVDPDSTEAHYNLGAVSAKLGRPEDAIRHYEEVLRINPDDAETHFELGAILAQAGRMPEAMGQWEQALRINPNYAEAHDNLGLALAQAGRVSEAIQHWEETLKLKPDDANTHYNLGLALEKVDRSTGAVDQYEQALKLRPDFIAASNALSRLRAAQTSR